MGSEHDERGGESTLFEAACAWCGPVRFEGLELHVGHEADGLFEFHCPDCGRINLRAVARRDVRTLLAIGVSPVPGPAPFELLEERSGPPIDWDDLIEFHDRISGGDLLSECQAIDARQAREHEGRKAA